MSLLTSFWPRSLNRNSLVVLNHRGPGWLCNDAEAFFRPEDSAVQDQANSVLFRFWMQPILFLSVCVCVSALVGVSVCVCACVCVCVCLVVRGYSVVALVPSQMTRIRSPMWSKPDGI